MNGSEAAAVEQRRVEALEDAMKAQIEQMMTRGDQALDHVCRTALVLCKCIEVDPLATYFALSYAPEEKPKQPGMPFFAKELFRTKAGTPREEGLMREGFMRLHREAATLYLPKYDIAISVRIVSADRKHAEEPLKKRHERELVEAGIALFVADMFKLIERDHWIGVLKTNSLEIGTVFESRLPKKKGVYPE